MDKMKENDKHHLNAKNFQILAILYPDELHFLQSVARSIHIPANTAVIEEGQDNQQLYLVKSGILHVSKKHHDFTFEIGSITPGEVFGEASILFHEPAGASVHTVEACELYAIDISYLQEIIQDNSRFNYAIHQLAERRSVAGTLAINPVFSNLPQAVREVMLYNGEYTTSEKGDVLFYEGDTTTEFLYLILSGHAQVSMQHPSNHDKKVVFANLTPGDEVGELAIITHKPRAATVTATSTLRLFKISLQSIHPWMLRYSDFEHALRHGVQKKLQHNLEALRQKD
ncbi:MAG: cyclic nucleotide-binding domain-containing protein [Zetaproteobacteria bacterium]|nr:cyclic nucleotide-binding domain-containing protein [Zetaproteobacteria bacterium]